MDAMTVTDAMAKTDTMIKSRAKIRGGIMAMSAAMTTKDAATGSVLHTGNEAAMRRKKGLSGSTLKLVAIVTMFIDHFAAVILDRYLIAAGFMQLNQDTIFLPENKSLLIIYGIDMVMRLIGRLGFPLFCFLLIEGYYHTRSKVKYGMRLAMFALISEIPFDLGFKSRVLEFTYQNVFFTLFFGFVAIWGIDTFCAWVGKKIEGKIKLLPCILGTVIITAAGAVIVELLKTDYASIGVITIVLMYLLHQKSFAGSMALGCLALTVKMPIEFTCFATVPLVAMYNGTRGLKLKYFFYLFYPVHILLLAVICMVMGI